MATTWIITADTAVSSLLDTARSLGAPVTLVALTPEASAVDGVSTVVALDAGDAPVEALAPAVAETVTAGDGDVVLLPNRPAERVIAGALAARLGAPVLTGVREVGTGSVTRARFGGIALETVATSGPVVIVADGGAEAPVGEPVPATPTTSVYPARVTASSAASTTVANLASAKRIVAVGRGVKSEADLAMIRALAAKLGAELACSRPLAEGLDWLPKDVYIGVSGQTVTPDLYLAIGISGQLQHMVGAQDARTIVVVNTDDKAPILAYADYAVVGDLYDVVPALTEAL